MDIKFKRNVGFAGVTYIMIINGVTFELGGVNSNEHDSKLKAIEVLNHYGIDYNVDEIKFEWGGSL